MTIKCDFSVTDTDNGKVFTCDTCGGLSAQVIFPATGGQICMECFMKPRPLGAVVGYDPVNHPKHYKAHPSGIECIQVTRHMNFNRGNAMKYIWRAGEKGKEIEDLEKARWYLTDEIERLRSIESGKPS